MRFTDIYSDVEELSQVKNQRNLVKRAVNRAQEKIFSFTEWDFSLEDAFFATVDDYTTGTVSVTNGSTTVTGSGTTFTSAMVGRKIRVGSENAYYTIASFSSVTSITLDQAYQGTTQSGASYSIYQDEYRLAADLDISHLYRDIEDSKALFEFAPRDFDILFPTPTSQGTANSILGIGRRQDTYTTGTISMASKTITGSSTAWTDVQGLSKGNRIIIGTQAFTIKSVDSATQITTYEATSQSIAAGTSYTIILDNVRIQLYRIPDAARNIYYRYFRKPAPLVEDTDEPEVPSMFQWLLIEGPLIEMWEHKGLMDRMAASKTNFVDGLNLMKQRYQSGALVFEKKSQAFYSGMRNPVLPANYDTVRVTP